MSTASQNRSNAPIDPALIASIVRKVMGQLRGTQSTETQRASSNTTKTDAVAISISEHIVTANTIDQLSGTPNQIFVAPKSIVTPAAADSAKERGIEIVRTIELPPAMLPTIQTKTTTPNSQEIIDTVNPERAVALIQQLQRRGITHIGSMITLSDTPATDLHRLISQQSRRAAMVSVIADVDRFTAEMKPDTWVIDMGRMNLVAAVNAVARIAQRKN